MRASCLLLNNSFSQLWPANTRLGGDSSAETQRPIIRSVSIRKTISCKTMRIRNGGILWQDPPFNPVPVTTWRKHRCAWVEDLKMCSEFTGCTETKLNLFMYNSWGFLVAGISFGISLLQIESLTTACLVVRKGPEVLIHFSQMMTVCTSGALIQMQQVGISNAAVSSSDWTVIYLLVWSYVLLVLFLVSPGHV